MDLEADEGEAAEVAGVREARELHRPEGAVELEQLPDVRLGGRVGQAARHHLAGLIALHRCRRHRTCRRRDALRRWILRRLHRRLYLGRGGGERLAPFVLLGLLPLLVRAGLSTRSLVLRRHG